MTGQTIPYRLPYPECDPPLTQDAADIADLRDLAVAVDTKMTELETLAGDLVNDPDAAVLFAPVDQVLTAADDQIFMTSIQRDNSPGNTLADEANSRFIVRQTGFYYLTIALQAAFTVAAHASVEIAINGLRTGPRGQSRGTSTIEAGLGVFDVRALSAGDVITFHWAGTVTDATVKGARGGIWRLA